MSLIDVRPIWGLGQPRSGGPRLAGGGPHSVYDKEAPHLSKEAREEREGCPMAPEAMSLLTQCVGFLLLHVVF